MRIFLDTTVLLYAVGVDHPLLESCRALVGAVTEGTITGVTTTVEVIQEFAHVRARRRPRRDAVMLAGDYAALLTPLVSTDAEDLQEGLRLFEQVPQLGSFDCVLAAAARRRRAAGLVSADRSFAAVPGLRYLDPSSPSFGAELAAAAGTTIPGHPT